MNRLLAAVTLAMISAFGATTEYHVAKNGDDSNPGTRQAPLKTIQRAADLAQPGDTVTVHQGVYRERVDPPRGGTATQRIVYQAAKGERVEIKGSEIVKGWQKVDDKVWKATIPNSLFGKFNPYADVVHGDWFDPRGRIHHTGAVYLNGDWLVEAAKPEELHGERPKWLAETGRYLLNVAWMKVGTTSKPASAFAAQAGVQTAPCTEGGECIGYIEDGDWARYEGVDFGRGNTRIEFRAAAAGDGGIVEVRLGSPDGELLGACTVTGTGDWQSWSTFAAKIKPTSGVKTICLVFKGAGNTQETDSLLWFAQVDPETTTVWAQFPGIDPNQQTVEINVRRTVFYPSKTGRNYITVRGFTMRDAATPWAPPTAEQIGVIGTNWSKGWIIENNVVSHSVCSGIALGKHGDQWDNTSADSAEGYVQTIERALANGWTMDNIGGHVVRNNTISHCEQTGIVGSLGAIRSLVEGNVIHDIHVRGLFSGAEMAGIKFHGAIDTIIRRNHIYRTCLGVWLDWMAQGTRVSRNLFHGNASHDLFVEVNHGPFLVDDNLFLSGGNLLDVSEGGAYVHNLFAGALNGFPDLGRQTPWHKAHSTEVAGLKNVGGGDDRFHNNLFLGSNGLSDYANRKNPLFTGGNVYFGGAQPYRGEVDTLTVAQRPEVVLTPKGDRIYLRLDLGNAPFAARTSWVDTALLGKALVSGVGYENPDGSPVKIDFDYFGKRRKGAKPLSGPFGFLKSGVTTFRVW